MKNIFKNFIDTNSNDEVLKKTRLIFVLVCLLLVFFILSCKLIYIAAFLKNDAISLSDINPSFKKRVDIIDRTGIKLASDIELVNFYLNHELVSNPKQSTKIIKKIFPEINEETLYERLINDSNKAKYILVKRNITPRQQNLIKNSGIIGFEFNSTVGRIYPHKNLFSHVVGYVDVDMKGIAGLEAQYNDYLNNPSNKPLQLTLDIRVQSILRQQLLKAIEKYKAKSAIGIVSEVKTGNILAIVSLPDFDPNQPNLYSEDALYNKATYGVYEMGSIFKVFTIALGLNENIINLNKNYDISQTINYGKYQIKQEYYSKKYLNPEEILVRSSNVGAGLIGLEIGDEKMKNFLNLIGMFERIPANFPSLARPLLPRIWRDINTITASYGHGIAVTPLHVVMAIGGIVNDGVMKIPRFTEFDSFDDIKIISKKTSDTMKYMLREVVKNGTGWRANTLGYSVGGKTGSARLLKNGQYQEGNIMANFVGIFPMNNPYYLVYVMIESPYVPELKDNISGGTIAAPVFSRIVENIAPVLNVMPYINRIE